MIPDWLGPLRSAVRTVQTSDLSPNAVPTDGSGRHSAIAVTFAEADGEPSLLLLQRASTMRLHAGQVAFPGGAAEPEDADPVATALREASEEVGLDARSVEVFATLPQLFLPPSRFIVTPILAWWQQPHPISALDPNEVAHVALIPIAELVDPANRFEVVSPRGWRNCGFEVRDFFIWGFTGVLIDSLLRLGGWERDWDHTVVRPIPTLGTVTP